MIDMEHIGFGCGFLRSTSNIERLFLVGGALEGGSFGAITQHVVGYPRLSIPLLQAFVSSVC